MAVRFGFQFAPFLVAKLLDLLLFDVGTLEDSLAAGGFGYGFALLQKSLLQEIHCVSRALIFRS